MYVVYRLRNELIVKLTNGVDPKDEDDQSSQTSHFRFFDDSSSQLHNFFLFNYENMSDNSKL